MVSLDCNRAGVSSASSSHIMIRDIAAEIQLPVARRSDFEMLLTKGLQRNSQQQKGPPDKQKGPMG